MGIVKSKAPTRPVVDLNKQGQIEEKRPRPEMPVSSFMKRRNAVLAAIYVSVLLLWSH